MSLVLGCSEIDCKSDANAGATFLLEQGATGCVMLVVRVFTEAKGCVSRSVGPHPCYSIESIERRGLFACEPMVELWVWWGR